MTLELSRSRYKAVALDVDGTLTDGKNPEIRPRAAQAIRQLAARGVPVFLLTGRRSPSALALAADFGLTGPMVTNNGASIVDAPSGKVLKEHFVSRALIERMQQAATELDLMVAAWAPETIYAPKLSHHTDLLGEMSGSSDPVVQADFADIDLDRIYKVNLLGDEDRLDELQPHLEEHYHEARRSAPLFYETSTPGATKWEGLQYCLAGVGVAPEDTVGVADGENDVDFISRVGLGVAVGNAYPRLKGVADLVIGDAGEDGTAIFLEELFGLQPGA